MELKKYQKLVLADLRRYLAILQEKPDLPEAYAAFWLEKGVPVGTGLQPAYQNLVPGVPNLCFKVPTGGGKTYLAACSIKPIMDSMPQLPYQVVVWLVPSDSILDQTLLALNDPGHPYRQQLNQDFGHKVEVYTKDQAWMGQNFSPTALREQLSVLVLSYDSFRTARAEGRRAYRESGYLGDFEQPLGEPQRPIEGADSLSLYQIINQMMPLVIVDESHRARSTLSLDMLRDFNPSFVLDLTATPTKQSNVLSSVAASQLKAEQMVKLPVIVYNRESRQEVLTTAIELRDHLERKAEDHQRRGGNYVRPIVLLQAQPRVGEDAATFDKLKERLLKRGIPAEQIAIKTGERNELKGVDLLSRACPIRYIITINALKEGWDCPFAYVLASMANRNSPVEVEQIIGRVLRQPHARASSEPELNMSYVITSSDDFSAAAKRVVAGLEAAGFSEDDYRQAEEPKAPVQPRTSAPPLPEQEDFWDLVPLPAQLNESGKPSFGSVSSGTQEMIKQALTQAAAYTKQAEAASASREYGVPEVLRKSSGGYAISSTHREKAQAVRIPQFLLRTKGGLFAQGTESLFEKENLNEGFKLSDKPHTIDLDAVDEEVYLVDVEGNRPVYYRMSGEDSLDFREIFSKLPPQRQVEQCKREMKRRLDDMDFVQQGDLHRYIDVVIDALERDKLLAMAKNLDGAARKVRRQIEGYLTEHHMYQFKLWMDQGRILCEPTYAFPAMMYPMRPEKGMAKALYEAEGDLNPLERKTAESLAALPNVLWWHRNPATASQGFRLNGFINHYPDLIVYTRSGVLALIETKGEHLDNPDSRQKLQLGRYWQEKAGSQYRYFMVFEHSKPDADGAYRLDDFLKMAEGL